MPRKNPHAAALGKLGGAARTPAKAAASRANGAKGGRRPHIDALDRRVLLYALVRATQYVESLADAACTDPDLVTTCEREAAVFATLAAKLRMLDSPDRPR